MRKPALFAAILALSTLPFTAPPAHAIDWILGQPILNPQQLWTLMDDKDLGAAAGDYSAMDVQMARLIYTSSPERTRANLASFVEKTRTTDPAGAAQMEQQFATTDVIGAIGAAMLESGLNKDNIADAYTVWAINAWGAVHGDMTQTPPATAIAVSQQTAMAFLQVPELVDADDATKQEMAESLLIQAALIIAAQEGAAHNPALMQKLADAVRQGAKASGLDLDAIQLTDTGFVPVKG